MGLRRHLLDHVELAVAGQAEVLDAGLLEVLQVVVVERARVDAGVGSGQRDPVIGQAATRAQPLLAVGEGVRPHRVDPALLLDVVQHLVDALVHPRKPPHLDANKVLPALHRSPRPVRGRLYSLGCRSSCSLRRRLRCCL